MENNEENIIEKSINHEDKITKIKCYNDKNKSKNQILQIKSKIGLSKLMESLNNNLNYSKSAIKLKPLNLKHKMNIFPDSIIEKIKEMNYYKKWDFSFKEKQSKIIEIPKKKINNISEKKYKEFMNYIKKQSIIGKSKLGKDFKIEFLKSFKNFCPPHKSLSAEDITKKSILENCGKNKLLRYEILLNEKIGNYIKSSEKYPNFYDFDKFIQKEINDEKIGLSIPGNFMNFNKNTKNCISIKVFHPTFIKERISKYISVPDQTLLPKPNGDLKNYSKITMKQLYPD